MNGFLEELCLFFVYCIVPNDLIRNIWKNSYLMKALLGGK